MIGEESGRRDMPMRRRIFVWSATVSLIVPVLALSGCSGSPEIATGSAASTGEGKGNMTSRNADRTHATGPAYNPLTPAEEDVILFKGTERPFTGEYTDSKKSGTYICRRCN